MKDDLNYSPADCFETFPFPAGFETNAALEAAGRAGEEHETLRQGGSETSTTSASLKVSKSQSLRVSKSCS